ncbi:MAG: malonyl-CoA decarboxylase [Proteobacteria bacterium]|nr:malonyl-CoA decarboxylase [Pseudomonadota bacterium]
MIEGRNLSFVDKTLDNLRNAWREIRGSTRIAATGAVRADLPDDDLVRVERLVHECLEARGGEVSARARAADLGQTYLTLDAEGRLRFLQLLVREFGPDRTVIDRAMSELDKAPAGELRLHAEARLRDALVSPRAKLFTQFTALPDGVKFLVDMRAEVRPLVMEDRELMALEADLMRLFQSWFDVGFLDLERITWESPASLLEKLIAYEAVHDIHSWDALKKRLAPDHRCFAFLHPRMPGEPIIFVEVALVEGMSNNIQRLIDEDAPPRDPHEADTAIFYSISNAQKGLAGMSFGGFLIKQVVDDLAREFKGLKTFATLSPVPGFCGWLDRCLAGPEQSLLDDIDMKALVKATGKERPAEAIRMALGENWPQNEELAEALREPLTRLCARYLLALPGDGSPPDPVARFHLRNGARIERINWLADSSSKGIAQSAGMMVNYNYRLADIEENHEAFVAEGHVIASGAVKTLAKGGAFARRRKERE